MKNGVEAMLFDFPVDSSEHWTDFYLPYVSIENTASEDTYLQLELRCVLSGSCDG